MNMTKPVLAIALMAFTACGHGSGSPTAPNIATGISEELTGPSEQARQREPIATGDAAELSEALALLGGDADVASLWDPKARVKLVSAPPAGSTFKALADGSARQPVPKFKLEVVPSHPVSQGGIAVIFLTASGEQCGLGLSRPVPLKARTAKQLTTSLFLVGPEVCAVVGPPCSASACKLPLTTTKLRLHFGGDYTPFAQKTLTRGYRWER